MTALQVRECLLLVVLGICTAQDLRCRRIFLPVPAAGIAGSILVTACTGDLEWQSVFCGLFPGILMLGASRATKGAVGDGDGWAAMACGALLGFWDGLILLMTALFFSAGVSGVLLITRRRKKTDTIAFVPFLAAAFLAMLAF